MAIDILREAMIGLVRDGNLAAHCPKCKKTLEAKEHKKLKCKECGAITEDSITYWPMN